MLITATTRKEVENDLVIDFYCENSYGTWQKEQMRLSREFMVK